MTAHESHRAATIAAEQAMDRADEAWFAEIARTHDSEYDTDQWTSNEGQPGTPLRAAYDAWVKAGDAWRELICNQPN